MPKRARRDNRVERPAEGSPAISAQVILRPASGKRSWPDVPITARNLDEYAPSPEDSAFVRSAFQKAGFRAGELLGISFTITGPLDRFEQFFGIGLRIDDTGAVAPVKGRAPAGGLELPLSKLLRSLAERILAVAFTPPAELHGDEGVLHA